MKTQTKFLPLLFVLSITGCNGQLNHKNAIPNQTNKMETFDIKKFKTHSVDGEYSFNLPNGYVVRQIENIDSDDLTEEIKNNKTPYVKLNLYFMKTGNIKVKGEQFYSSPIGIWRYFDENGKLIKEINWEADYKFTIENLHQKMLKLDVNIMEQKNGLNVHRTTEGKPLYFVSYPISEATPYDIYELTIDGITGETLEKVTMHTRN